MQFMRCAVVAVLIALHLCTDSCCHYIPDSNRSPPAKKNATSTRADRIQICGDGLTNMVIEACNGILSSLSEGSEAPDRQEPKKITEECCDHGCSREYLEEHYCGRGKLFKLNDRRRGKSVSKKMKSSSSEIPRADEGPRRMIAHRGRNRGQAEVRVRGDNNGKRKFGRRWMKKKRSFKRKCAYKSFGHYLLKLDRGAGSKSNLAKVQSVKRSWPPLQIGTVPPEMDKFGGQPIVVVKKIRSNSV